MTVIALEEHMLPRDVLVAANVPAGSLLALRAAQLDDLGAARLAVMDEAGIDVQVLSAVGSIIQQLPPSQSVAVSRRVNDVMAGAAAAHPDRYRCFATLPMADPRAAVDELRRTVDELGFVGAMVHGQTHGVFLDDPSVRPVLAAAEQLAVPIYLHPAPPPPAVFDAYYSGLDPALGTALATYGWGWHAECGMHVLRMVVSGVFERFSELQIIVGHMGENLPFSLARADDWLTPLLPTGALSVTETVRRNVHITICGYTTYAPLQCSQSVLGVERIMFAVDYPFSDSATAVSFINDAPLDADEMALIKHGNAQRLLGVSA